MPEPIVNSLRDLPSVDRLLNHPRSAALLTRYNRDYLTHTKCRATLDQLRANIRQGNGQLGSEDAILDQIEAQIGFESRPGHVHVVNATGTNLRP